ncbi:HPr kinase/phosphorylase [Salipiger bermudensis]|uniref:Hpr serine kinase/phosphatase domain protein n=1 Tax=Salipiger bermudensis (strain DSM 26914 / JCM 13377 / KCTC 12554 / HTCC2601) TaxID=314265 RepID=Q0FHS2_SALBH|nr:HPr kinase/phosphatase C-terminal domain-containing protein [Salipiger bermudensis]EAU43752.1 Hpr serine kinase/phosphatase domain protein [Salipiger bermudensis HTCC2601]
MPTDSSEILHATAVAVAGRGLLIRGASGSGKSGLALEMMARGALLVADDRVIVSLRDGALWLAPPAPLSGMIEARGIGLLNAATSGPVRLAAVLDLDEVETARLPQRRETMLQGQRIPLLHKTAHPYFPAALVQYLKGGRKE